MEKCFLLFINMFLIILWNLKPSKDEIVLKSFLDPITHFSSLLLNFVIYLVACPPLPWEGERDAEKS